MIRKYLRVIYIKIKKFIIGSTLPAHDVLGMSPEGPPKVLTSETYQGALGNSQGTNTKTDYLMRKLFFRRNSSCIACLFLFFRGRTNIQKF